MSVLIVSLLISIVVILYFFIRYSGDVTYDIPALYIIFLIFIIFSVIVISGTKMDENTHTNQIDKKASIYCGYHPETEICKQLNKISFKNLDNILTQEQKEKISNSVKDIENKIQNIKID